LVFLLVAIAFTWPLTLHLNDGLVVGENYGDPLLNSWIIAWNAKTVFTHPSQLFQANIFYPSRGTLAYSEHLFILGVLGAPVYHISHNPVLTYNLLLLFGLIFSAFGCYLLIKELTGSRWGALAGGLFFAFCPYKISQLLHLHIAFSPFLPFALLYLYRYLLRGKKYNLGLFLLFFLAQSLTGWHYLVFCSLASGLLWLWFTIFTRRRERWRRLFWVLAAVAVAALLILPLALPYFSPRERLPDYGRELSELGYFSASAADYLSVPSKSILYGGMPSPFEQRPIGSEEILYPGLIITLLALAGLLIRRRAGDDSPAFQPESFRYGEMYFLILTFLGLILTFGPKVGGISEPLYSVPYKLGLIEFIRVPTRFYVLAALGLSVLAGFGAAKVAARCRGLRFSRLIPAGLILLLLLEAATLNLNVHPVPVSSDVPEVYSWLDDQEGVRVIELPVNLGPESTRAFRSDWGIGFIADRLFLTNLRESSAVYFSTYHWKELVNGYSGYFPHFYRRIMAEMQSFPSSRSLDLLSGLRIDYVIWHWDWVEAGMDSKYIDLLSSAPGLSLVGEFGDESVYAVQDRALASPEDLELDIEAPQAAPEEEGFNMSIVLKNTAEKPLVVVDEDKYRVRIRFLDSSGDVVYEEWAYYHAPLFLDAGDETFLPLEATRTPPKGDYEVEIEVEGGILEGKQRVFDLQVMDAFELNGTGTLEGSIDRQDKGETFEFPFPDGLFPILVEVTNTGDAYWCSKWDYEPREEKTPYDLIFIGVAWIRDGEEACESQVRFLPSDVSSGQSLEAILLIRPQQQPGDYELHLYLVDADLGTFGMPLIHKATVKDLRGE
ncbi:MAG: hypothetical protein ACOC78_01760, partial [Actinomycetota bacterium]